MDINDEGDAGRVDVADVGEVEQDGRRVVGFCLAIGGIQRRVGKAVNVAEEIEHGQAIATAHGHAKGVSLRFHVALLGSDE